MKRIILISLCLLVAAGCGKKQSVQKPQEPDVETQPPISVKPAAPKQEKSVPLYPVKSETKVKTPEWVEKIISIHNQNYDSWREKSSSDTSTVLIASLTSSSIVSSSSSSASATIPAGPSSSTAVSRPYTPPSILKTPETSTAGSSRVSVPSSGRAVPPVTPPAPDSGDTTPKPDQPPEQPSQSSGVSVVRTIQNTSEGSYIRLTVSVTDTRINGIIVSENIPDGYTVVSSTPAISKRTGNTIKWLFYGTSLTDQTISYQLTGSGKATVSGSFSSTLGSGTTTGDSQLGQ